MKKSLFLTLAMLLCSGRVFASVCFLGDTSCQEGEFTAVDPEKTCREQSSSWVYESDLCEYYNYKSVCNDRTGNYYEQKGCLPGHLNLNEYKKYECDIHLSCGQCCPEEHVKCKSEYKFCTNNTVPVSTADSNTCVDSEGTKYRECQCDTTKYPYSASECSGRGLTSSGGASCRDDDGVHYESCECASGFDQTAFSNIKCSDSCPGNCDLGTYVMLPGSGYYCWDKGSCHDTPSTDRCTISYQSNFDNFWGGYDVSGPCHNLNTDCASLGYNTGTAGTGVKCEDGSEPFRCPFDHSQVYCESGIGGTCTFASSNDCQKKYFGSTCTADASNCYNPTSCKSGYAKTQVACSTTSGNWSLGTTDEFGCGKCTCTSTCVDKVTKIPTHATPVTASCTSCGETKTITTGFICTDGYVKTADGTDCEKLGCSTGYALDVTGCNSIGGEGFKLGTKQDAAGCFQCVAKTCADYGLNQSPPTLCHLNLCNSSPVKVSSNNSTITCYHRALSCNAAGYIDSTYGYEEWCRRQGFSDDNVVLETPTGVTITVDGVTYSGTCKELMISESFDPNYTEDQLVGCCSTEYPYFYSRGQDVSCDNLISDLINRL